MEIRLIQGVLSAEPEPLDLERLSREPTVATFFDFAIGLASELGLTMSAVIHGTASRSGRNEGILRGLAVRTVKLLDRVVAETSDNHQEMVFLLDRPLYETVVNLAWLSKGPDERFDLFVWDGMTTPRIRRAQIEKNIANRGGVVLPIEQRQLEAIADEAALAGVDLSVPQKNLPGMPSFEQRADEVFGVAGPFFYTMMRMGSGGIHGNWKDIICNHVEGDEFQPILEWHESDPSPLIGIVTLVSWLFEHYTDHLGLEADLGNRIRSIIDRIEQLNTRYEALYEARRNSDI